MESVPPSVGVKRLDADVRQILRKHDTNRLPAKQRSQIADLQQNFIDARMYTQAYELSETREEQLGNAKEAKKWLTKAKRCILSLSEQDVFGAVDVAQLSAQLEQVTDQLK